LHKSEALYRLIVETANEGVWAMDAECRTTYINPVMPKMLGYRMEEMIGRPVSDFMFLEDLDDHKDQMSQRRQGWDGTYERRFRREDGSELWCIVSAKSLMDGQGQFQGSFGMFTDITQRRRAEEALQLAARQWQATFDAMSDAICLLDMNSRILGCNQAMGTLVGQPLDEILGCHCYEIIHGTSQPIPECPLTPMLQSRQREEVILPHKDRWFKVIVDPILDETGTPLGVVHRIADITLLIKSEEALKLSLKESRQGQKEVKALLDASRAVVEQPAFADVARSIFAAGKTVIGAARGFASLLPENGHNATWLFPHDNMPPELVDLELPRSLRNLQAKAHRLTQPVFDNEFPRNGWMACMPEGNGGLANVLLAPLMDDGRVLGFLGFANKTGGFIDHDVCLAKAFAEFATIALRQKWSQEALRESEAHFRQLFESSADAIFLHDQGQIIEVNEQACRSLGYSREELLRLTVMDIETQLDWRKIQKKRRSDSSKDTFTGTHRRKDGSTFPVEVRSSNFPAQGRNLRLAAVRDITAQRQADEALRQSRETLRVLLDATPAGVCLLDLQGMVLAVNKVGAKFLGKTIEELVETNIFDHLPAEVVQTDKNYLEEIRRHHLPLSFEECRWGCYFVNYVHPILSTTGELKSLAVLSMDITARKQAEEALAQQSQFLQLLIDTIPTPVFYKDAEGRYLGCNQGFLDYYGVTKEEMVGKTVDCLPNQELANKCRQKDLELLQNPGVQVYEHVLPRPDGQKREVVFNKATFLKSDGAVGGLVGVITDITDLKQAQNQLRALAAQLAEAEEKERHIIARELHDEVGQGLTALGLNLTLLKTQMSKKAATPLLTRLADAVALVEKIGETIRNVMAELRPPVLDDYGLLSALRWYGKEFSQRTNIGLEVQGEEATPRLPRSVELALFRIAQEALTNVAKHARASRVELIEEVDNGSVRLVIADNGIGFDQVRVGQPEGRYRWGLMNMSERAAAAGGSCHIESRSGHGTRVVVEVSR
jgi:PAS domain S-box-containing protein